MAQYVFPKCPHCEHKNTFDLEVLGRSAGKVYRKLERVKEYYVDCARCRRSFVIEVGSKSDE